MTRDPNQRLVICFLGGSLVLGVIFLGVTSYKGEPIDLAVVGVVSTIIGSFTTYLTRPSQQPPAPPPGTTETKTTTTPPGHQPKITVETKDTKEEVT